MESLHGTQGVLPQINKGSLGVLPQTLLSILGVLPQKKISSLGVLPQIIISNSGITPFTSFKAFWELYISSNLVLESSGITPGDLSGSVTISTLGVLPENLSMFCGSNISNLYILSILILV